MRILLALLALALPAAAGKVKTKEIGPKAKGKLYEWKSDDGLAYRYFVPKDYDPKKGANLTFILHGSNLSRTWGFANHPAGKFRPHDIVVSPDGTTANGRGGFNLLGKPADAKRLHALQQELKGIFKIKATFLYGHSQGSFFALYYAGEYPDDVQGVVAHASGVWTWTKLGDAGHKQAIVLMHGTQDPVVPYAQSVGGYDAYAEKKYPVLRLRSLENWNHWPAELNGKVPHTSQQLAWVEGMTCADPERVKACFDFLADVKVREKHDHAAAYTLAKRIVAMDGAPDALKKRAQAAMNAVNDLAAAHVAALKGARLDAYAAKPWVGHLPVFLRGFMDVPARDEYAREHGDALARHREEAVKNLRQYYQLLRQGSEAEAFVAGVAAVRTGFLHYECADKKFLERMAELRKQAKKLKIPKDAIKAYDAILPAYTKAQAEGLRAYEATNRKAKKF